MRERERERERERVQDENCCFLEKIKNKNKKQDLGVTQHSKLEFDHECSLKFKGLGLRCGLW